MESKKTCVAIKTSERKKDRHIYSANDEFCYKQKSKKGAQRQRQIVRQVKRA